MPRSIQFLLAVLLVAGLAPAPAAAQIAADRPGFGDGATTVTPGTVQLGLGYALDRQTGRAPGETTHEFGQVLLRGGLANGVELRGGLGSFKATEGGSGYDGAALGAKVRVLRTSQTALSGVATASFPLATDPFASPDDRVRQELKLAFDGALGEGLALSVNSGASFFYATGTQDNRATEGLFIPTLSFGLSEETGAYVGYAGFYGTGPNENWVEGGVTFTPNADTQFDVNTGLRVDSNIDTGFFVGFGLARRF